MSSILASCAKSTKNLETPKDKSIEWGKAGQEPKEVWKTRDWIIVDSHEYICVIQ